MKRRVCAASPIKASIDLTSRDRVDVEDAFSEIVEMLGAETVLDSMERYFSSDDVYDFCKSICTDYDIDFEE